MPSLFMHMGNLLDFMMFLGCILVVLLAIWGVWIAITILVDSVQRRRLEFHEGLILLLSLSSILLAVLSVSDYWKKCVQVKEKRTAIEMKIRNAEQDFDRKMRKMDLMKEEWKKSE